MTKIPAIGDVPVVDDSPGLADFLADLKGCVQILAGQIGAIDDRAIRRGDVVVRYSQSATAAYAAAAPTKAEFDKLVDDTAALRKQLDYLIATLKGVAGS